MKSQNLAILSYLKTGQAITPLSALKRFGCLRLSARIYDLREAGHQIKSVLIEVGNKHVSKYSL